MTGHVARPGSVPATDDRTGVPIQPHRPDLTTGPRCGHAWHSGGPSAKTVFSTLRPRVQEQQVTRCLRAGPPGEVRGQLTLVTAAARADRDGGQGTVRTGGARVAAAGPAAAVAGERDDQHDDHHD